MVGVSCGLPVRHQGRWHQETVAEDWQELRVQCVQETVEAGILPSQLIAAARNYASSGDRAIYNPKRFLKEQHWQDYQKAPKPKDTSIFNKQWDSM